jgi:hypothetical protein
VVATDVQKAMHAVVISGPWDVENQLHEIFNGPVKCRRVVCRRVVESNKELQRAGQHTK